MRPEWVRAGRRFQKRLFTVALALWTVAAVQPIQAAWWESPAMSWLLGQSSLNLTGASFQWPYPDDPERFVALEDVAVALESHGARRQLALSARLTGSRSAKLELRLDATGELVPSKWDGSVDIVLQDFPFEHLSGLLSLPVQASHTTVSTAVRSTWKHGELMNATGDFVIETGHELGDGATPRRQTASAKFALGRRGKQLLATFSDLSLLALSHRSTAESTIVEIEGNFSIDSPRIDVIRARSEFFPLAILDGFAGLLAKEHSQSLSAAIPHTAAGLSELSMVYQPALGPTSLRLSAEIENLKLGQRGWQPALHIYSGQVQLTLGKSEFRVLRGALELDRPQSFAGILRLDAYGSFEVRRTENAWQISAEELELWNDTLDTSLFGQLLLPDAGEPQFDLKLNVLEADIAASRALAPRDLLHPKLSSWIERSLLGGQVTSALIEISSERDDSGYWPMVKARATAVDGTLAYAPGWPPVTRAQVLMEYSQGRFRFSSDDARIAGATARITMADISDIDADEPLLRLRGEALGSIQQGVDFIEASPLVSQFKHVLDNLRVAGPARLDLGLGIWLGQTNRPIDVAGQVRLRNGKLNLVPALRHGVKDIRGTLEFDATRLSASELNASYLDRPIKLSVRSAEKHGASVVTISGTASSRYLGRHLTNAGLMEERSHEETPLIGRMRGDSNWLATIEIPHTKGEDIPDVTLLVESDLQGIQLELPSPLDKPGAARLPLSLRTVFGSDRSRSMALQLGALVGATIDISAQDTGFVLERGLVRFGAASPPALPADHSIRIDGHIETLDFGDWYALLESAVTARGEAGGIPVPRAGPALAQVDKIEVSIDRLELFDIPLQNLRVQATRKQDGRWLASLLGSDLLGEVVVPAHPGSQPVQADFDRLNLLTANTDRASSSASARPDPNHLPALNVTCRQCQFGPHKLGVVKFNATPVSHGLKVDNLYVLSSEYEAHAAGTWLRENGKDHSALKVEVHSDDLSALLGSFGYAGETTTGGATNIVIEAQWPGSPADFALANIEGILHFRSSRGTLLTVSPGATGRVFGLLMLPRLPRRLFLDFSDLFSQGLDFDLIEGSFSIEQGHAYTNNFVIDSPSVRIDVAGRTGLVDETYDQVIAVTPKLSASLPFAPVWLAEKLHILRHHSLDKAFAQRYTVTGSWQDPKVQIIQPPEIENDGEQPGS